jgi:hypothetical protein
VLIEIEKGIIYSGSLPNKQLKKVFDWLAGNGDWVLEVFYELNAEIK